jgi:hypothetical protein
MNLKVNIKATIYLHYHISYHPSNFLVGYYLSLIHFFLTIPIFRVIEGTGMELGIREPGLTAANESAPIQFNKIFCQENATGV